MYREIATKTLQHKNNKLIKLTSRMYKYTEFCSFSVLHKI